MTTSRIHIQPCAAGYEYRLGPSGPLHVARRDDVASHLYENVHALHCMLTGERPFDAGYEDHLIRRIASITRARLGPRPGRFAPDRPARRGEGAAVREPACTYRSAVARVEPLQVPYGRAPAGIARRRVGEPGPDYSVDAAAYWQLATLRTPEAFGTTYLIRYRPRVQSRTWRQLVPVALHGPTTVDDAADRAGLASPTGAATVWLPLRWIYRDGELASIRARIQKARTGR